MSQIKHPEFTTELKLKAIELINSSINFPGVTTAPLTNFSFDINLESKAEALHKLIFVIVSVEIKSEDQSYILGSLTTSCIYDINNFDELMKSDSPGNIELPPGLMEILNSISISTTRGVMFSTFKGTFLHNAFLPIIDPASFQNKVKV